VNGEQAKLLLHYYIFHNLATLKKLAYLSTPKFLTGRHYSDEEISWHLKEII
jgi:hypothetical protein